MKKLFILVLVFYSITMMANAQTKIVLSIGNESMTANLVDNEATRALVSLLEHAPITIDMSDYGGFEKVGELPQSLPTSNTQITTEPGDIMLYQGRSLVVFYGSNSWSYTRLGRIDEATVATLRQFLGSGDVKLRISLDSSSGAELVDSDVVMGSGSVYDLNGNLVTSRPLAPGVYITNGKKIVVEPS